MRTGKSFWYKVILLLPAVLISLFVFVIPFFQLIIFSFWKYRPSSNIPEPAFSLANYSHLLITEGSYYLGVYWDTIRIGFIATVIVFIVSYPLSWYIARQKGMKKGTLILLVMLPMIGGGMIQTLGWIVFLMPYGVLNGSLRELGIIQSSLKLLGNDVGVIIGLVQSFMPVMILPLVTALGSIDPTLEPAARSLGAGPWKVFFKIIFPLSLPGAIAGALLVFLSNITSFVTPLLLGLGKVQMFATVSYTMGVEVMNYPFASAFAFFPMVVILVGWLGFKNIKRLIHSKALN